MHYRELTFDYAVPPCQQTNVWLSSSGGKTISLSDIVYSLELIKNNFMLLIILLIILPTAQYHISVEEMEMRKANRLEKRTGKQLEGFLLFTSRSRKRVVIEGNLIYSWQGCTPGTSHTEIPGTTTLGLDFFRDACDFRVLVFRSNIHTIFFYVSVLNQFWALNQESLSSFQD